MSKKTTDEVFIRYSESFKQSVIRAIEEEGMTISGARKRYGINGHGTIQHWLKKYGKNSLLRKKILVMSPQEQSQQEQLQAQVKTLKEALVKLQLSHLATEAYLDIACGELGEEVSSFKKKADEKGKRC